MLQGLDLTVQAGERVLLAGPSGAGKSTLLRALAGLLLTAESGDLAGEVLVDGASPERLPGRVALLLQDPTAAVVAERVGRDVAFGPENLRLPREEIWRRVHEALERVDFPYDVRHPTAALSGGESQRLALAGALALRPAVVLLDEPTSMLDDDAAAQVRRSLLGVVGARGSTMVVVEHRIEPWVGHVDRLVVLDAYGAVVADGDPQAVLHEQGSALAEQGVWVPGYDAPPPLDLSAELVDPWESVGGGRAAGAGSAPLVAAEQVSVRHRRRFAARGPARTTVALDRVSARLLRGEALAVTGSSGAGKSTLLSVLAGLQRPDEGRVGVDPRLATGHGTDPGAWPSTDLARRLCWVPQTAEHGVVTSTVADEVRAAARAVGRDARRTDRRADGLLEALGLVGLADRSPHHLSGGEQRRLMLAAALAHGPDAVLLDEPTVGQDRRTWAAVAGCCRAGCRAGLAVGAATHDRLLVDSLVGSSGDTPGGTRLTLARGREVVA